MAKAKTIVPAPVADKLIEYKVAEGVTHVDGKKVKTPTVMLTRGQALYDLSLDRISPAAPKAS
jgi:hypothetical protein